MLWTPALGRLKRSEQIRRTTQCSPLEVVGKLAAAVVGGEGADAQVQVQEAAITWRAA